MFPLYTVAMFDVDFNRFVDFHKKHGGLVTLFTHPNSHPYDKSLAWSSVVLAFENSKRISEEVKKPKALGDIRGVSYIYPILWRFGLIRVPEAIERKVGKQR